MMVWSFGQHMAQHRAEGVLLGAIAGGGHFHHFADTCTCGKCRCGLRAAPLPGAGLGGQGLAALCWLHRTSVLNSALDCPAVGAGDNIMPGNRTLASADE